eukprot:m.100665 g.100665  ORF g.100665 m.100665 type:complete len:763 (+) comp13718_c0_seq1:63-2351(+)
MARVVAFFACLVTIGVHHSEAQKKLTPLPLVTKPFMNGISMDSGLDYTMQPMAELGFLDVTKPPFNADSSGKTDSTTRLQQAIDFGRLHYLTVFFPEGDYRVNSTLRCDQPGKMFMTTVGQPYCNNMPEVYPANNMTSIEHCGRTAPSVLQGSRNGKARIILTKNSKLSGPVVRLHNPINENINMNQVLSHLDIVIEEGNEEAQGVYARAAQGTSVQSCTIYAGTAAAGLVGGAGSGGSHIDVTVVGGQVGIDVSQSQPSPTLTGISLINQTGVALSYGKPGRQTLSVVGLTIVRGVPSTGPAIYADNPITVVDASIQQLAGSAEVAIQANDNVFAHNVFVTGYKTLLQGPRQTQTTTNPEKWTQITLGVQPHAPRGESMPESPIFLNGTMSTENIYKTVEDVQPPANIRTQHIWNSTTFPSFQTEGLCNVKDMGAKGDGMTDDYASIQSTLNMANCSKGVFFPKGYYAVTKTLQLPSNAVIVGASRIYSNIIVHSSVPTYPTEEKPAFPLVQTATGPGSSAIIYGMTFLVWHHYNSTYAFKWQCDTGIWRESHINRVDLNPGVVGPGAYYNRPFMIIESGGGQFYNLYQENWEFQGPKYRHALIHNTSKSINIYHGNLEHARGEANLEIDEASGPIKIFGYKGEGNFVQVWVKDSADVFLSGYGGNASPFPSYCYYPKGYEQYTPTIFRFERVNRFVVANLITQTASNSKTTECGIFSGVGFAGRMYDPKVWKTVLEVTATANITTPCLKWPVAYIRNVVF